MKWRWSVGRVVHSDVETLLNCANFSLSLTVTVAVFCLAYCNISVAVFVWHTVTYLWQYFVWHTVNVTYLIICGSVLSGVNVTYMCVAIFCLACTTG